MFTGKSIWEIIQIGGFTMYLLIICSVISLAILAERLYYYWKKSRIKRESFMADIKKEIENGHIAKTLQTCKSTDTPFSKVAHAGLSLHGHNEKTISLAMEREITIETIKLERYTSIVATIGSTAVYIGLFGTVLGIIRAFNEITLSGSKGVDLIIGGIPEALVCTAAGLLVAIPAVVSYNFFSRRIDGFVTDMELCASELVELLCAKET